MTNFESKDETADVSVSRRKLVKNLAASAVAIPAIASPFAAGQETATNKSRKEPSGTDSLTQHIFNIVDFGAVPDGTTLCTKAIQAAVDACAEHGGGRVVLPPGRYLSGPIFLKSNLELELMAGATLLGSTNFADYPTISGSWEGNDRTIYASLLTGLDLENVTITGSGTINGQGEPWWKAHRETMALRRKMGITEREPENPAGSALQWPRPRTINLYRCKRIRISGITILNSPSWNIHPLLCEDIWIDGLSIVSPQDSPNTDGIDPESCKLVRISNCYISTGDDCIVLKSGYKHHPGVTGIPTEDVAISNCVFGTGHAGVAIGSETAGGVRRVAISNCVCDGTRRGLYFKTARGRGNVIEDVRASNFVMRGIIEAAVITTMFYDRADRERAVPVNEFTPTLRNLHLSNIVINGAKQAVLLEGLRENPIQDFSLSNLVAHEVESALTVSQVHGATFSDISIRSNSGPGFSFSGVKDLELLHCQANTSSTGQPLLRMENVAHAHIQSCVAPAGVAAFLELKGAENQEITVALNRVPKGANEVAVTDGASAAVVSKLT